MRFQEIAIILPGESLDDFADRLDESAATELLKAWSFLWHPTLLAACERIPAWHHAESAPEAPKETLLLLPKISISELPEEWLEENRKNENQTLVLEEIPDRFCDPKQIIPSLQIDSANPSQKIVKDFYALGMCYLAVEQASRRMRYSSYIDLQLLEETTLAAAKAAMQGDVAAMREQLSKSYDSLLSARDYFYPVESYLIDVTLIVPSIFGEPLRKRLAESTPTNILLTGEILEQMADKEPESVEQLRIALENRTASLIGGNYKNSPWNLLPISEWLQDLQHGLATFERILGHRPYSFGRYDLRSTPLLPQAIDQFDYKSILALSFDGGTINKSEQCKSHWEGADGSSIEMVSCTPSNYGSVKSMATFGQDASDSMEDDFVATQVFAGWPGTDSPWYEDLKRAATFGGAIGTFVTLDTYFEETANNESLPAKIGTKFDPNDILQQKNDPIGKSIATWNNAHAADQQNRVRAMMYLATSNKAVLQEEATQGDTVQSLLQAISPTDSSTTDAGTLFLNSSGSSGPGYFAPAVSEETSEKPNEKQNSLEDSLWGPVPTHFVKNVPLFGFQWAKNVSPAAPSPLAEGNKLQNEFIKIEIDPVTGAIQRLGNYNARGPRVAQQLAFRTNEGDSGYSVMAADEVKVTTANSACGEITVTGRLLDTSGESVATFTQATRILRNSPIALLDIQLTAERPPEPNQKDSYYAIRFAWPDEGGTIFSSRSGILQSTEANWLTTSSGFLLDAPRGNCSLFPMGLPLHRMIGHRMLDSILLQNGEKTRRFRYAVGIGMPEFSLEATNQAIYEIAAPLTAPAALPTSGESGWLFHPDATNILVVQASPSLEKENALRIMLLETTGHLTETVFRCCRSLKTANGIDQYGEATNELTTTEDGVQLLFKPFELLQIEITW